MTTISERFKDAPWFSKDGGKHKAVIGGAGGIGSWLALFLARAGFEIVVYDPDHVELHNLGGQLYTINDVTRHKTTALRYMIRNFANVDITEYAVKLTQSTATCPFCFSAFDNMTARRDMFEVWKRSYQFIREDTGIEPIFIDGRLLMEQLQIFCVTKNTIEQYDQEYLFEDSEVEDAPCTMRQTSHIAAVIGGLMTGFFTNHISNMIAKQKIRNVPFFYEYFLPMNLTSEL